ncbi:MAG: hypothetical protein SFY56_02440 [Bacteroidota bacterium]|nr:hypothetical protein [Bacteroidota bacterium]
MRFVIILFLIVNVFLGFSQSYKGKIDNAIAMAKKIDSDLNTYTKIEKYKDSLSSKIFYTLNDTIQKIEISTIENNTLKKVNWYYQNINLFYIEKLWCENSTQKLIDSEKIIIESNKIIAWLNANNQLIDFNTNEYNQLCLKIIEYGTYQKNLIED